jgi:amino acid adenylation domain-containing protein
LAEDLRSLGVGAEVLIGVCLERSLDLIVALLGILKAGGAYLPLDPAYPPERLAFMVQDSQAAIVLTQQNLVSKLPPDSNKIICGDRGFNEPPSRQVRQGGKEEKRLSVGVKGDNLAYVIYTSGSTGTPKGVAIEHSSAVTLLHWAKEVFTPAELAGVLAATSICFDLSVFELFVPLSWGGTVILAENILALPQLKAAEQVTLINTVPSAIAALCQTNSIPASVRSINLAGEALSPQLVQQLYEHSNVERVVNLYGPSEDTTYSTYTVVERGAEVITIGKPIANTQVYILDAQRKLVPVGVPGEIYLGGAGLARGYLHRTELTAQKFITNEFNSDSRLYKTGDLGRYLADGSIEFLGRIDHQVKIRGFRIELGEIETILNQHPAVCQVVVTAREDAPGEKRLVAYVVSKQTVSIIELRDFLSTKLPEYMIPSAFVLLESLPLTPNGKLDRLALPQPESTRQELAQAFISSRNPVEEMLAGIWSQVLGVKEVGIYDNFFELGGHSLLATQVIQRSRQAFKIDLPLRCLFESPTVAKLAQKIATLRQQENYLDFPVQPVSRNQDLALSFAQQRLWFFEQLEGGSSIYHLSVAVRLTGEIDISALEQSLNEIVKRHEILRTNFVVVDGQPVQVINPSLELKISVAASERPFDLSQAPLIRVSLVQESATESLMLLTMHHLIADGWSMGVFLQELATLYEAYSTGQSPQLPELPIQYADFALWQKQYLQGEVLATQLNYWKQQLKGELPVLDLPCDRPRPQIQTFTGKKHSFLLPKTLTDALKTLSQQQGVTLFMTLLAAFQTLLYRYTNQEDILIGSPIANRNRREIESLIGCFANTLVLRTNLSGNPTFKQLLERVREVALGAYHHQDLPLRKLVEELQPQRNLSL